MVWVARSLLRGDRSPTEPASRGIRSRRVLLSMRQIPREIVLEQRFAEAAYEDGAVPIPKGQPSRSPTSSAECSRLLRSRSPTACWRSARVQAIWRPCRPILAGRFARWSARGIGAACPIAPSASRLPECGSAPWGRHRGMAGRWRVRRDPGVGRQRGDTRGSDDATSSLRTTDHAARQPGRRAAVDEAGARARRPLRRGGDQGGAFVRLVSG